ncbi:3815_t:CDS:1 [Entrophospora sp. SA101]|nr:8498_t:CDS:1 [Entrophospora sp. SA101]CAJ0647365.1 3815_t:CDS:1 [Entrophospora sp. SA101]CAJ0833947.1 8559_t:CDS:1 [Entrophospora sp. SA101]CAJ0911043.1 17935_t:CDS:1 [Entrophospora sp. SA101]
MKIFLVVLLFLAINVAADGRMTLPEIRLTKNDAKNNFRNARSPAKHYPCGTKVGPGKVLTTYTTNQVVNVQWDIENALEGTCFVDLSTTGKDTDFKPISTIDNCADKVGENFQADVKLPENTSCERCTLRFRWIPKLSEDVYLNCADISILPANKSKLKAQKRCGRGCGGASAKRDLNSNSNFSSRKELKRNLKKRSA